MPHHHNALLLDSFIEMIQAEKEVAANTAISYRTDLELFQSSLPNNVSFENATKQNLRDHLSEMFLNKMNTTTIARHLSSLRQFFKFFLHYVSR